LPGSKNPVLENRIANRLFVRRVVHQVPFSGLPAAARTAVFAADPEPCRPKFHSCRKAVSLPAS
jgi:hypothetical protein